MMVFTVTRSRIIGDGLLCSLKKTVWVILVDVGDHVNCEQNDPMDRGIHDCVKGRSRLNIHAFIVVSYCGHNVTSSFNFPLPSLHQYKTISQFISIQHNAFSFRTGERRSKHQREEAPHRTGNVTVHLTVP